MKLRYIFTALAAAALAFVGCQEEERFLDEVQVSQSVVAIDVAGGQVEVTVAANDAWEIVGLPEWATATPLSGEAGDHVVTISAEPATETREAVFYINVGEAQQVMNVLQMAEKVELPFTDCATVLKDNAVGTVYKCKGTITDLTNYDKYGCFYINDGTATVYVYGSMNPTQFKPEVGDIISFEGPWTSYGNFDDVTILGLEKSLIKFEKMFPAEPLPLDGGVATVLLTVKEGELEIVIPEDAAWLTAGEPETLGGMTSVELTAAANDGGARSTTVTFKVNVGGKDYLAMATVEQLGAIAKVSVADFLAASEGTALYELTGVVKNLANTTYGNFDLVDATGSVYVYGLTGAGAVGSNDKSFASLGINEGDVITIVGTRASYKETPQVGGTAYFVEHVVAAKEATVTEFLAQSKGTWCKVTGTIANLVNETYGNFDLVGEDGASVYVYGLTTSFVAKNDKSFAKLGLKEGDIVTLVGKRDAYNDQDQVGGPAYYISHEAGAPAVDPWETATSYDLPESASSSRQVLRNIKFYADDNNINIRLVASVSKIAEAPTDGLTISFYDKTNGTAGKGFYGWWNNAIGDAEYNAERCGVIDGANLTMTVAGNPVDVQKAEDGDLVTWTFAFPRSANAVLENAKVYMGILTLNASWDATGAMPDKYADMFEVTLP